MFARMVLPLLGGTPAVWNTCLVFYQLALLAGYLYAHTVGRRPLRQQVVLQAVLILVAAIVLPIAVRGGTPPPSSNPIGWIFGILLLSLGLPFVVLATTGPLLQRWYAALQPRATSTIYSLFAASNAGSFLALFGYPFVVEPLFTLRTQTLAWAAGYALYAAMLAWCGALSWRRVATVSVGGAVSRASASASARPDTASTGTRRSGDRSWQRRLRWLGLAALPSTLMMSVTTFISTDVASIQIGRAHV